MNDVECLWRKKGMSAHQFDDHIRVCSGVIEMGCHGCARALWPTIERVRCGEWWSNMFLKLEIDAQKKSLQLSLPVGKSKLATTRLLFYWHVFCVCVCVTRSHILDFLHVIPVSQEGTVFLSGNQWAAKFCLTAASDRLLLTKLHAFD